MAVHSYYLNLLLLFVVLHAHKHFILRDQRLAEHFNFDICFTKTKKNSLCKSDTIITEFHYTFFATQFHDTSPFNLIPVSYFGRLLHRIGAPLIVNTVSAVVAGWRGGGSRLGR